MVGFSQHEDKQMIRQALIAKYINLLYEDVYQDWSNRNESRLLSVARHALALSRYRREKMPPGATSLEAFADFRDWMRTKEDEALEFLKAPTDADVLKFLKDPNTAKDVRNAAFSYFKPDEYPTHRMLQELMYLDAGGPERDQVIEIATLLLPWCREGNYGCLFDGVTIFR
jgi:type IV secretion system protein TrbE